MYRRPLWAAHSRTAWRRVVGGLLLRVSAPTQTRDTWVQRHEPRAVRVNGRRYELIYRNRQVPLGFVLTLNRFRLGTYPGGDRPRSYESHVTTLHPATGREQSHLISMNHPAEQGGYTLYQSSYSERPNRPTVSLLSVARDPGQPVVFAGYVALMLWDCYKTIEQRISLILAEALQSLFGRVSDNAYFGDMKSTER